MGLAKNRPFIGIRGWLGCWLAAILLLPSSLIMAQNYGVLRLRADISGPGVWMDDTIKTINPGVPIKLDIYSLLEGGIYRRITWWTDLKFEGTKGVSTVIWGALDSAMIPEFAGFWDMFKNLRLIDWNGSLPDTLSVLGLADDSGYPVDLGELKILSLDLTINDGHGFFTVGQSFTFSPWEGEFDSVLADFSWRVAREPSFYACGDFDNNGVLNIKDMTSMILYIYGDGPGTEARGDVNGDGLINIKDIGYLIRYIYLGGPEPICI